MRTKEIDSAHRAMLVTRCHRKMKLRSLEYKGGKCQRCGYSKSSAALVFHHRDPNEKEFSIGSRCIKWDRLVVELDKCDLLCQNCHHEIHEELDRERTELLYSSVRVVIPERKIGGNSLICDECGAVVNRVDSELRGCRVFCSVACKGRGQERILWPSVDSLRDLVWRTPITKLAKVLGISNVSIKRRCRKLGIETPGVGYWSKNRNYSDIV